MTNRILHKIIKALDKFLSFIIFPERRYNNFKNYIKSKLNLIVLKRTYWYLGKYYKNIVIDNNFDYQEVDARKLPIWQLWLQGKDSAPIIVQKCLSSVRKYTEGREVIVLTADNWQDYIELPELIMDKFEQGIITYTHFSDILRVCLLEKYGGTWIDATVLMTDVIPVEIGSSSFFAFEVPQESYYTDFHLTSSWFIHAKPNHLLLKALKQALFNYWQSEQELIDYFLLHLLLKGIVDHNPELHRLWSNTPHISNKEPHALQFCLLETFDQVKFNEITSHCAIHKLTYKIDSADQNNTFLSVLLNDRSA